MGTKLHPPHPKKLPACTQFWFEKYLQCLKNVGLYNSFGISRFSFWHSLLTQAGRLANSQASASNAGVPMLGTQTCLSLIAHTWPWVYPSRSCIPCKPPALSSSRLVCSWWIQYFQCNLYVNTVDTAKQVFTQWNLRVNWSTGHETGKEAPKVSNCVIQGRCQQRSKS